MAPQVYHEAVLFLLGVACGLWLPEFVDWLRGKRKPR